MEPYDVALLQTVARVVRTPEERDEVVNANIERIGQLLRYAGNRTGEVKLAVTGEYALFGQFRPRTLDDWLKIAPPIPNPFTDRLCEISKANGCYLAAHFLETVERWPGRYFNTALLFSPEGKIVLRYRKHNGPNNLNTSYTGPGDIYSEYVDEYGEDALFPVVDTPIGRIGMFVCGDVQYPEVPRCLTFKGADVLLHLTADIYRRSQEGWEAMRRARAAENNVYILSASTGGFLGSDRPVFGWRGRSQVFGPDGITLALADGPGESVVTCAIDPDRLRWRKSHISQNGHVYNETLLVRADLYAREYMRANRWPTDGLLERPMRSTADVREMAREILARLVREGHLLPPEADCPPELLERVRG